MALSVGAPSETPCLSLCSRRLAGRKQRHVSGAEQTLVDQSSALCGWPRGFRLQQNPGLHKHCRGVGAYRRQGRVLVAVFCHLGGHRGAPVARFSVERAPRANANQKGCSHLGQCHNSVDYVCVVPFGHGASRRVSTSMSPRPFPHICRRDNGKIPGGVETQRDLRPNAVLAGRTAGARDQGRTQTPCPPVSRPPHSTSLSQERHQFV
ncbi:hypothetical protein CLUG_03408 [Clavispora lusitaniae ATCC 42720]|uniref:Uncharacterized protein n=1 Tax=Clavispora lusitaniae (strain ATCC 42720) TaxID=306902 RepID=C4Y5H4_CLAL4|nr:uncharacterized protein CLUG_03408 [Clavispora lusitaniae ATCC 42720]EEQ39279.1 hypothetical protein CLUG_03408 [Clavispora lusitaniae ATCC 42720]